MHPFLTKDVDLSRGVLVLMGADGEKRLYRVVGDGGDGRGEAKLYDL